MSDPRQLDLLRFKLLADVEPKRTEPRKRDLALRVAQSLNVGDRVFVAHELVELDCVRGTLSTTEAAATKVGALWVVRCKSLPALVDVRHIIKFDWEVAAEFQRAMQPRSQHWNLSEVEKTLWIPQVLAFAYGREGEQSAKQTLRFLRGKQREKGGA